MAKLAATARDYEIAIVVVHHMRKSQGPEGEKRVPNKHDLYRLQSPGQCGGGVS